MVPAKILEKSSTQGLTSSPGSRKLSLLMRNEDHEPKENDMTPTTATTATVSHLFTYRTRSGHTVRRVLPDYQEGSVFVDTHGLEFVVLEAGRTSSGWSLKAKRNSPRAKTLYMGAHYAGSTAAVMNPITGFHV